MTLAEAMANAKRCTRNHAALKSGPIEVWRTLLFRGVQIVEADETGPEERLELRDCSCGSTLSRKIG